MKVIDFVNEFKNVENKEEFVLQHIVDKYVPFIEKVERCKTLVRVTTEKIIEDDRKIYSNNSSNRHLLHILNLMKYYTDLEIDFNSPADAYDMLTESKALYVIHENLPKGELAEWQMILDMELSDSYDNYRTMTSWLDSKFDAMELMIETIGDAISETIGKIDVNQFLNNDNLD